MAAQPDLAEDRLAVLRRLLLTWYGAQARPLAWRDTRDPWSILVSEIMLQQTQAARVEPLWIAFCDRFPTPASLAEAPVGEVVSLWRGLGYNRRAVNLHRAAAAIVAQHDGAVPRDLDALRALPGIGEYTARAVQAFAFGLDAAPVDTNVARVMARAVRGEPAGPRATQELAQAMVPLGRGSDWSQALMDLGARVCTARRPRCDGCPVRMACAWVARGGVDDPASSRAARVPKQPPFAGSDRYHRGRLVDALRAGPVPARSLAAAADLPTDPIAALRVGAIADGLVIDGLAEWIDGRLQLPG